MKDFIEIYQLIQRLEDFFKGSYDKMMDIGEIAGCNLMRYVGEQAAAYCGFENTLFVSGIQDYVYGGKERDNFVYWKNLFSEFMVESVLNQHTEFHPVLGGRKFDYVYEPNTQWINNFSVMVINQAQFIPEEYLKKLCDAFRGAIVRIFDPFDSYGANYMISTICVDTFEKLPVSIGFARSLYGVETRSVNKKAKGSVIYGATIGRRSVGRVDQNQYVTNDEDLYESTIQKQLDSQFRKNQKLLVMSDRFRFEYTPEYKQANCISRGTLLHIVQGGREDSVKCRIHASKSILTMDMTYEFKPFITPSHYLRVNPANIMTIWDAALHFHDKLVYVYPASYRSISIRDQYTLIKSAQNVVFAETK